MTPIALLLFAGTSLALALHAFVTYPLSLLALRWWQGRHAPPARKWSRPLSPTRFAICTYVDDTVGLSASAVRHLVALRGDRPSVQILIHVDGEGRGLRELLEPYAGSVEVISSPLARGKSHAMNALANRTRADVLVFADARMLLDERLLDTLDAHFADREVGCVCAAVEPAPADTAAHTAALQYRRLDSWIRTLETDTGSTMGANGSLFAVRAALYHPAPVHALHDMYVSMMVLCGGHRVVWFADLRARADSSTAVASGFLDRRDMAYQALCVHRLMWSTLARLDALSLYKYVSHKLLRWFSVYLLAMAGICFVAAEALSGRFANAAVIPVVAALLWLLGNRLRLSPFAQAFEMLAALTGAGMGAARAMLRSD